MFTIVFCLVAIIGGVFLWQTRESTVGKYAATVGGIVFIVKALSLLFLIAAASAVVVVGLIGYYYFVADARKPWSVPTK